MLKYIFILIFAVSNLAFAQYEDITQLEDRAKTKYITDKSKQEYRYQGDTVIESDEDINGNILVVRGDLVVHGSIDGDVVVLYGDARVKGEAFIDGNLVSVEGRIYQDSDAKVSGNQIETHAKNLVRESAIYNYDHDYDYDYEIDDDDWDWSWSRRFYGEYGTLPIKDVDDTFVVRYNRVQGAFFGLAIPKYIGGKYNYFTFHGFGGYGFKEKRWRYQLGLDRWLFNQRTYRFEIGGKFYDLTDTRDDWLISTNENSLAAFLLNDDYHDFYRRKGFEVHISQNYTIFLQAKIAYRNDEYESVKKNTDWSLFSGKKDFRSNPPVNQGNMRSLYGELYYDSRDNIQLPRKGWFALLGIETSNKDNLKSDFSFNQYILDLRRYQDLGYRERLDIRIKIGSAEGELPLQKLFELGGLSTLRGYYNKEFVGDRMFLANFEFNINPHFNREILFIDEFSPILFFDIGRAWFSDPLNDDNWNEGFDYLSWNTLKSDLGIALAFDKGNYRFSFAKRLDSGKKPIVFSFRLIKPF